MRFDHYEKQFDWIAAIIWTWLILVTAHSVWLNYKDIRAERRMTDIENYQGPQMPTEWTLVSGKVVLYQSPYYVQVCP